MDNVIIRGVGKYIPKKVVNNDFFVDHFKKEENGAVDVTGLMNSLGRSVRHVAEKCDNSLLMGYKAAMDVISRNDIDVNTIDMIVFVSTTPEYTSPTNALKLNAMLNAKNAHMVYDMNCNCTGMLVALDTVSKVMKCSNDVHRALIVGSMYASSVVRFNDSIAYPCFGDAGSAVILDKVADNVEHGFIDYVYHTDSRDNDKIRLPSCGHSVERMNKLHKYYRRLEWIPFDTDYFVDVWYNMIHSVFERNDITDEDVAYYLFSQFSDKYNQQTLDKIGNVDRTKYVFNADKYGYVACSSPILALDEIWDKAKMTSDKYLLFCSVAAGTSFSVVLYKL